MKTAILPHHENKSRANSTLKQFRESPKFGELVDSFVRNGFVPTAAPLGVSYIGDATAEVDALAAEYTAIEKIHIYNDEDNKIIVSGEQVAQWIKANYGNAEAFALAVSGTRRSYALPIAQVVREQLEMLPIEPRIEELEDSAANSLHANLITVAGLEKVTAEDRAAWLLDYSAENSNFSESDLVKLGIKRGQAQQMHRAYQLHKKFPKLQLLQNIAAGVYPMPHKEKMAEYLKATYAKGEKDPLTDKIRKEISGGDAQRVNRADKRKLESAGKNASSDIVRYILDCVNRNAIDEMISETDKVADRLNEVFEWGGHSEE